MSPGPDSARPIDPAGPIALVLTGVSGVGKSTVARLIAERTGWAFCEADELQPATNVARMKAGIPLTDLDRHPWLIAVRGWIDAQPGPVVVSCSALRRSYRALLAEARRPVWFVELTGDFDQVWPRLSARSAPYMNATQLESQYAAQQPLTVDEPGARVSVDGDPDTVADRVLATLDRAS